ncbi:MAG: PKD domain-containing protein [Candidatus Pacebacteria bacterium]|nr:PKD domain-containing protein [Candidatus Paceibacterota bacterium]
MLLDSAFSLSNSGEQLVLRDADLVDRDAVTYTAESGAAGDGRTLSRVASNSSSFVAQVSTPGSGTLVVLGGGVTGEEVDDEVPPTGEANSATTGTAVVGGSSFPVEPQIYAHAGKDRFVLVGADSIFEGKALSKDGELLEGNGVRYVWNFGDGAVGEGVVVSHHFAHPGVYVVVLDVSSGKYVGTHRITVTAEQPHLTVKRLDDGAVQILNASTRDIDLSFWHVRVGDIFFTIPKNTILLRRGTSTLRQDATKLPPGLPALVYPNGREALLAEESAPPVTVTPVASSLGSPMTSKAMPVSASSRKNGNAAEIVQQDSVDAQEGAHDMATTTESSVAQSSGQVASAGHIFGSLPHWGWIVALVGMLSVVGAGLLYALPVEVRSDEATVAESGKHDDPAYIDASKWTIIDADEEAR